MKIKAALFALVLLSACKSGPTLPDPRVDYPLPPAELMAPPKEMKPA